MSTILLGSSFVPPAAEAAFPGENGLIILPIKNDPIPREAGPYFDDLDLFTMSPEGSGLSRLTSGPEADFDPAWSPDGKRVAFARAPLYALAADIYVMNRNGSELTNVTNSPQNDDYAPDWSPDGERIVYTSWENFPSFLLNNSALSPGGDIYIMNKDGSNAIALVDAPGDQGIAAWSPRGDWIAYYSEVPSLTIDLIRPDGSGYRSLTRSGRFGPAPYKAEWSPDGKWLAFGASGGVDADIWVIRVDGKRLQNLTNESSAHDQLATWSPDGTELAFISDREGGWRLFKMRTDGSGVRRLIDIDLVGGEFSRPDWGPRP